MGIEIIFNSPQFLYIDASGAGPISEGSDVEHMDQYAIASRLSYFFLNTTPDTILMEAAANGALGTASKFKNMQSVWLMTRFLETLTNFHDDWLDLYTLDTASRDDTLYPTFTEDLLESMQIENDLFVSEVSGLEPRVLRTYFFSQNLDQLGFGFSLWSG